MPIKDEDEMNFVLFTGVPLGFNSSGENETYDEGLSSLRVESPRDIAMFGDRKGSIVIFHKKDCLDQLLNFL